MPHCRRFDVLLALIVCHLLSAGENSAFDWPQFRGPNRNGISNESGILTNWPATGPRVLWKFSAGDGFSAISISNGRAYTMGNTKDTDTVFCLDAKTGDVIWEKSFACPATPWAANAKGYPGTRCTPTIDGGKLYVLHLDLKLRCLDTRNGDELWTSDLEKLCEVPREACHWGLGGSPLIFGDRVFQHVGAGAAALDKTTGQLIWNWKDEDHDAGGYASPLLFKFNHADTLAILTKSLVALDPADGKELWRLSKWQHYDHGLNASDPVFLDDKVFLSQGNYTQNSGVFKLTGKTDAHWLSDSKLWSGTTMLNHFSTSILFEGNLYGFHNRKLRCVDFGSGTVKWDSPDPLDVKYGSLILCGKQLICLTDKGELIVAEANPESFKPLARSVILPEKEMPWTAPALAQGLLYCRTSKGTVICVDLRKE